MIITDNHGNLRVVSKPRSIVRIDGFNMWLLSWNVNLNSTHEADDFTIQLPFRMARNVQQGYLVNSPEFTTYLFTNSEILVEIFVGYPNDSSNFGTSDLTRIMYGYVDTVEINANASGETVTLAGRNRVADFLDNKTTEKYQNMTSSAIAQMFANNHGLETSITPTYTLAGQYYNGDSVALNKDITEWDLLTFLAEQEGFELRVRDNTLYFGPFDAIVGSLDTDGLNYTWGQNVEDLMISRSPHGAKNIIVEVHSYDSKKGKHIRAVAKRTNTKYNSSFNQRYYYSGLTMDQAQKKAQSILDQLSKLEVIGSLSVSGNEKITVDRLICIYGTGMGLSEKYYVRKATHSFDYDNGYRCEVNFSNLLLSDEQTGGI